eukprot:6193090-Pleurochrysis_carterae.AAC.1
MTFKPLAHRILLAPLVAERVSKVLAIVIQLLMARPLHLAKAVPPIWARAAPRLCSLSFSSAAGVLYCFCCVFWKVCIFLWFAESLGTHSATAFISAGCSSAAVM